MSRSSPGVQRVAAILNFIADHPGQAFALTDLVRALKLSRATCHALLTGLVDVGYLYRTSDKTYVLGPALAAIGRTAAEHFSPLQVAKPEMRELADTYDVVCAAYFLEGDMLHLRDRAASAGHIAYPVPMGNRMPIRSAQVPAFLAWSQDDVKAWLGRAQPPPAPDKLEIMLGAIDFARANGFVILVRNPGVVFGNPSREQLSGNGSDSDELPVICAPQIDLAESYPVAAMMAPVFDKRGRVSFALVMAGFHSAMSGEQAMAAGTALRAACQRISAFSGGGSAI